MFAFMCAYVIGGADAAIWEYAYLYGYSIRSDYMETREFCNVFWNWLTGETSPFANFWVGAGEPPEVWPWTVFDQCGLAVAIWNSLGRHPEDEVAVFRGFVPDGRPQWHAFLVQCREGRVMDMSTGEWWPLDSPEIPRYATGSPQYRLRITWPFWIVPDEAHPHTLLTLEGHWPDLTTLKKRTPWEQPWNGK